MEDHHDQQENFRSFDSALFRGGAESSRHQLLNATGAGHWAFTVTGMIIVPTGAAVPVAQLGSNTADMAGNTVGTQRRSLAGSIVEETFTGTTLTNPDCTGKATVYIYAKQSGTLVRTSTLNFVFIDGGRGVCRQSVR
jgi:hypothetical protein